MVFNKFTHLARPSLSKTLTHGYAQSVVAATQSSAQFPLVKHHGSKSGRPTNPQHTPFSTLQTSSSTTKPATAAAENLSNQDGGLKAYYEAWHNLQQPGSGNREWQQYQFPRLIESQPQGASQDETLEPTPDHSARSEGLHDRRTIDRSHSASAADDIRKAEDRGEEAAIAQVNEAIATVIDQVKESSSNTDAPEASSVLDDQRLDSLEAVSASEDLLESPEGTSASSPLSLETSGTSVKSDSEPHAALQHLKDLHDARAWTDIPPAFEALLREDVKPTATSYHALLSSAINLPMGRHQLVPRALDIYSDMLRRKVQPSGSFYSTLIQVLSRRALFVAESKHELGQSRNRYLDSSVAGGFRLQSKAAEYAIVAEDDALSNALRIFGTATAKHREISLSSETYELLILACASNNNVQGMVQVYQHLEAHNIEPVSTIFPAMITAFVSAGDLASATECYNEYRDLAIQDDAGHFVIIGRNDSAVYAALVKGYTKCGKTEAGDRFVQKIVDSFSDASVRSSTSTQLQETINLDGVFQEKIDSKHFAAAYAEITDRDMGESSLKRALSQLCIAAADDSEKVIAAKAYEHLSSLQAPPTAVTSAMIAMHLRHQDLEAASSHWKTLSSHEMLAPATLEPLAMYAQALITQGYGELAVKETRDVLAQLRHASKGGSTELGEQIDEVLELLGHALSSTQVASSAPASISLLCAMLENGGLMMPVAEQMLASLNPGQVAGLQWQEVILALQVQAAFISDSSTAVDSAHVARLDHLIDLAARSGASAESLGQRTTQLIDAATKTLALSHPDILDRWVSFIRNQRIESNANSSLQPIATISDNLDPYSSSTDFRGSTVIIDELESHRNAQGLKEALARFRNIRRAGRHPRYIAYAKLITSAAKEGRSNLVHDILGMARTDVPYMAGYSVVRHGWSSILDAMVGACLTIGKRNLAEQYHQELLSIGSAPSANAYGLYITTLKESTKTFDEASEAVKIFHRAITEGVAPSSFLYNALIGKLGKARRIDDCLRYFQEMRSAGIKPTSVTYGTIVNALCRVSDERFAEELFDEMESMSNYKPRPAPYNSLMQYFLTTKRDSQKVLAYYKRMQSMNIAPTMHTYKLLIDTYATLDPIDMSAAEGILGQIRAQGLKPEAVHYASLIHAKGCVLHDMDGARKTFDEALACKDFPPQACLYQALFESMVANHAVSQTEEVLDRMSSQGVEMTPYIANTLIHGWATENQIAKSKAIFDSVSIDKREPSTYESMTRAFLTAEDRKAALAIVHEMLSRGYPSAVSNKVVELVGHGTNYSPNGFWPNIIA